MSAIAGKPLAVGSGEFRYRVVEDWAKLPRRLGVQGRGGGRRRRRRQRLRVQSRRAPDGRVRPRRQFPALLGRRHLPPRARPAHRRPTTRSTAPTTATTPCASARPTGKVLLDHRRSGQAGALHERRAVPSLHAHRAVAERRHLRLRRLRQRARAQVLARRQAAHVVGRAGHRSRPVQPRPQHLLRRDGWVYVADRENHRVQVFDGDGRYETQWNNLHRPCGLFMPRGKCPVCYIGELGPMPVNRAAQSRPAPVASSTTRASCSRASAARPPGTGAGRVHRAARPRRRLARRHLRRRGVLDQLDDELSRHAAPGGDPVVAEVSEGSTTPPPACGERPRVPL